jgi:peptidoglycan/LPS O-acetylase OafA/YrhL
MIPLHSLTALRFFAALYILVYHRRDELSGYASVLDRIVAHGYEADTTPRAAAES